MPITHPIPGLPAGFTSRGIDPVNDVTPVTELCNAAARAEYGIDELDENVQEESYRSPGFDPERDALVIGDASRPALATAEYWDTEEAHVSPYLFTRIHPDLLETDAGAAIGAAITHWANERARLTLDLAAPDLRVTLTSSAASPNAAMQRILEAAEFVYVRSGWQMQIDLDDEPPPPAAWPAGIAVRSAAPSEADLHAIHDAENDSFADHYGFVPNSYADFVHYGTRLLPFEPALWRLAMDGDQIAGICLNQPFRPGTPDVGWVGTLGVRRAWRRRGVGEALLRDAFGLFHARGTWHVGLGVDASSLTGATRLYERVGMRVMRESRTYEKRLRDGRELRTMELAAESA